MQQGTVIARVYTSDAYLPLAQVPVVFTQSTPDGTRSLLAIRATNSSGLTEPVLVETPDQTDSLFPGSTIRPYTTVNIQASKPGYSSVFAKGVQIFPGVETIQGIQLRPVSQEGQGETDTILENTQNL